MSELNEKDIAHLMLDNDILGLDFSKPLNPTAEALSQIITIKIKQAEQALIEEIETFHIANCMRTVKRYQCKECVCGDFICQWQQLKQKRGK